MKEGEKSGEFCPYCKIEMVYELCVVMDTIAGCEMDRMFMVCPECDYDEECPDPEDVIEDAEVEAHVEEELIAKKTRD